MLIRFNILFLSVLFAINLWAAQSYTNYSSWIGLILSLILVLGARIAVGRWIFFVLPAFLVPGSVFLLFLIDSPSEARIFSILASFLFYFSILAGWRLSQYEKDETAKAMHNLTMIGALFLWFAAAFGWYMNVAFPIWGLMTLVAFVTFMAAYSSFSVNQLMADKRLIYSVFLASVVAQTVWVQNFWPFGYLTTSVITLIIYCVGWEMILNFFLKRLTARTVFFEMLFLAGSVILVLISTKWYPVI